MAKSRVPMESLTVEELGRARRFALERPPRAAAAAMRLDEQTVFRVLSGYPVHRATVAAVRALMAAAVL